jgi:hypothetical protein
MNLENLQDSFNRMEIQEIKLTKYLFQTKTKLDKSSTFCGYIF